MNKPNIKISVDNVEYKVNERYEFSDCEDFSQDISFPATLAGYNFKEHYFIGTGGETAYYIRPIQQKDLSAEELYRVCGREGLEVKNQQGDYGKLDGYSFSVDWEVKDITHFRKAYSTDEWRPISEIRKYVEEKK